MFRKTRRTRRLVVAIALGASLASWSAPSALSFDGRSPDTRDAAGEANVVVVDARSPDTLDAAEQAQIVTVHAILDSRSPDARDAGDYAKASPFVDLRSPDARDGTFQASPEIRIVAPELASPDQFHWGDFGIGLGVAFGSVLALAGLAAATLARQKRGGPATT
jgi:hypothetical protein